MRLKQLWWSVLVAAVLGGLVGVTAVAAAGAQFIPVLNNREGTYRNFKRSFSVLNERTRNDLAHADTVAKRCGVQGVISSGVLPATIRSAMAFPMPGLSKMPFFSPPVAR
jgi:membrane protein DedA with SNARE-associated domain